MNFVDYVVVDMMINADFDNVEMIVADAVAPHRCHVAK